MSATGTLVIAGAAALVTAVMTVAIVAAEGLLDVLCEVVL